MVQPSWFEWLFLPAGYPNSVAPEYKTYQIWDTIQQVLYFVNTVISQEAVMKFHGVGDPSRTAVEATALSLGRGLLAAFVSLFFTVPALTSHYKKHVQGARLSSECLKAAGHAQEIAAAAIPSITALLYSGPIFMQVAGSMGGASRSVIMSHFARANNNGDVSLKESNQDAGGKIAGLFFGIGVLVWMGSGSGAATRGMAAFATLTVVHVACNIAAVMTLEFPPPRAAVPAGHPSQAAETSPSKTGGCCHPFVRCISALILPPGYPHSVAPTYGRYAACQALCDLTIYPKALVTQLYFWSNVYGVGRADKTPQFAVILSIFMMSVDCVAGLISGVPSMAEKFYEDPKAWRFRGTLFGQVAGETLNLAAAMLPSQYFFPVIVVSSSLRAFGGLARKVVDATIAKNWSRSPMVELVHVNVAARNQSLLAQLSTAVFSLAYVSRVARLGETPSTTTLVSLYTLLQCVKLAGAWGCAHFVPEEAEPDVGALPTPLAQPLLSRQPSAERLSQDADFGVGINEQNLAAVRQPAGMPTAPS